MPSLASSPRILRHPHVLFSLPIRGISSPTSSGSEACRRRTSAVGPRASHQLPMPSKERLRGDEERGPPSSRNDPADRGHDRRSRRRRRALPTWRLRTISWSRRTTNSHNPSAAPGDLELVRRFVNALDIEAGSDALATPSEATAWPREQGWPAQLGRSELRELVRLREALRDLVGARGAPSERAAGRSVDVVAIRHPVVVRVTSPTALAPSSTGVASAFIERILTLVAAARDRRHLGSDEGLRER